MINNIKKIIPKNHRLALYLAYSRLLPKSDSPGIVLLPRLAFLSIFTGVAASILILSLSNGLHHNYLQRLAESDSHLSIISVGRGIPNYRDVIQRVKQNSNVIQAYPYSQNEALLRSYGETTGIVLKSYPKEISKDKIFNKYFQLIDGTWSFDTPRTITIGETLSKNMSLFIGDYVDILTYDKDFGTITYRLKISGIFSANDSLLDKGLVFVGFEDASEIFGFSGYAPNIGIRIRNYEDSENVRKELFTSTEFNIKTWKSSNLNTLLALDNEKQVIKVLLLIFFCVAFFGILSVMTALVADKRDEIALLKTLGMTSQEISYSFLLTGLLLGIVAVCIGIIIGILLSLSFNDIIKMIEWIINNIIDISNSLLKTSISKFNILNQNVYYLKEFPIRIQIVDIIFSAITALMCTVLAACYPAWISKKFNAADILRKRAF